MVEEFDGLSVEGEVIGVLIVEEVDSVLVQSKGEGFKKRDVVSHDFLIREVKLVDNDRVDMVVGEEIVDGGLIPDVFKQDVEGLEKLNTHIIIPSFLVHELQEE